MKTYGVTHIGRRETNEDRFVIKEFDNGSVLLAVADGMGGHAGGEKAAEVVCGSLLEFDGNSADPERELTRLTRAANLRVSEEVLQNADLEGMGSTLTAVFVNNGVAYWVNVGDSRLYLAREDIMVQVTDDHTIPGVMLQEGEIGREEARLHPMRNMLLSCIGREKFQMDSGSLTLRVGDLLLLSTDGLHDRIPEEQIASIIHAAADLESILHALVNAALDAGGRDNITIVALEV